MTDLLDMAWERVSEAIEKVDGMSREEKEKIGLKAMELISDYPLYASQSNITYEEAILIAFIIEREDFLNSFEEEE